MFLKPRNDLSMIGRSFFFIGIIALSSYLKQASYGISLFSFAMCCASILFIYFSKPKTFLNSILLAACILALAFGQSNSFCLILVATIFYLYFSESYNLDWKLTEDFKGYTGISNKNNFFEESHFKAYEFLNGWHIDPSELEKNSDGNYTLYLYFKPQSYFYLGLIISGTTLISCLG